MSARTGLRNHPYRRHRRTNSSGVLTQGLSTRRRRHIAIPTHSTRMNPAVDPGGCIDLTANDTLDGDVIDLTTSPNISAIDSPVVVISPVDIDNADAFSRRSPSTRRQRSYRDEDVIFLDSELLSQSSSEVLPQVIIRSNNTIDLDSDDDLPSLPFEIRDTRPAEATSPASYEAGKVTCPICLDSDLQIQNSGRQLYSTMCGHIFCNVCIKGAINTQHSCPNCRKKLTMRQIHPVFL